VVQQKQIDSKIDKKEQLALPIFTKQVKVGSAEFEHLLTLIAQDAEKRRKAGSEERPFYALDLIRQARLGALRLPIELGGGGASIRELFYALIRLAEADPDAAHSLRAHYWVVEDLLLNPDKEKRDTWLQRIAKGDIIGNAFTEISSKNVGHLVFETTLSPDGEGYRLNGTKYFSTGTLYADWILVMASTSEGNPVSVLLPAIRQGVTIVDDWDGFGQKLTGSGTTRFQNVYVEKDEVTFIPDRQTPFNSYLQLFLQAVITGILRNVVSDATALVQRRSRTFSFAAAETPAADPQLQQIIGQLSSTAFAAEAIVLAAADELDNAVNGRMMV
jgi:alkylation response protein AidB-like acyl-CoA dehydrogenase